MWHQTIQSQNTVWCVYYYQGRRGSGEASHKPHCHEKDWSGFCTYVLLECNASINAVHTLLQQIFWVKYFHIDLWDSLSKLRLLTNFCFLITGCVNEHRKVPVNDTLLNNFLSNFFSFWQFFRFWKIFYLFCQFF